MPYRDPLVNPCPDRHDTVVVDAAFIAFWPKLWQHLKNQPDITDNTEAEWKASAHKVFHRNYIPDGYELAKDFESENWQVDADFVELVDWWEHELYTAHQKLKEAWVIENGIKPLLFIGATVKVLERWVTLAKNHQGKAVYDGEITKVDTKRGEYHVFIESVGHLRAGSGKNGVTGVLVGFADLESTNPHLTVADEDDQIGRTCDDA